VSPLLGWWLVAGVSAKPNLTSNRPAENFNLVFRSSSHSFFADNQPPMTFVDTNTCLSSGHFLDAVNTSSVGVLSTEYELNTTCSLQVLDDLDSSQVAPRCRSTITCIFMLHFEALPSISSIVRGQLDYIRLSRLAQRRTIVATSHTEFTHSETYRQPLIGQRCIYQDALFCSIFNLFNLRSREFKMSKRELD